ncbi:MAG: LysM peptidoglycan-binding domain-containing protein [Planctomycetes bacterium]|nr:LysM peptidoglycan-binding domain-containing protein [Planctomycetota bacterium]
MGNFEKLSVVVIVVIIVMILVVALHTWTDRPDASSETASEDSVLVPSDGPFSAPPPAIDPAPQPDNGGLLPLPSEVKLEGPGGSFLPIPVQPVDPVPPVTPAPAAPALRPYIVQAGDSLGLIAQRELGGTRHVQAIRDANPGLGDFLREGQTIQLPSKESLAEGAASSRRDEVPENTTGARPGGTYTTRNGDTWERISRVVFKTKERWPSIFALNSHLHDSAFTELPAGLEIKLPN